MHPTLSYPTLNVPCLVFVPTPTFLQPLNDLGRRLDGDVRWEVPTPGRAQGSLPATGSRNRAGKHSQPCKREDLLRTCGLRMEMMVSVKGAIVKRKKLLKRKKMWKHGVVESQGGGERVEGRRGL